MNPVTFGIVVVAFVTLASVLTAIIYYVRHWLQRHQRLAGTMVTEGVFFKRYLPPALRARYDRERQEAADRQKQHINTMHRVIIGLVAGGVMSITLLGVTANWDRMTWIDLTNNEIAALNYTKHNWVREPDGQLPQLAEVLPLLRARGVALISADTDSRQNTNAGPMSNMAAAQWRHFLAIHRLPYRACLWDTVLEGCPGAQIYVVLPGNWNRQVIEQLLSRGASLLLYGPPTQLFSQDKPFEIHGLRFSRRRFDSTSYLAVVGDQVLTLGFDAGLVAVAAKAFEGYTAQSATPQAVAFGDNGFIGGELQTRLYARAVGTGRLVWMDFSPDPRDHPDTVNTRYLEALDAAVFRYLLRRGYSSWATWPDGKRFAGMLAEDTEDKFERAQRAADLARRLKVPITWFIVSNLAQEHRGLVRQLAEVGEIACHGDSHASFADEDRANQVRRIARCRKVLTRITGDVPMAFRPPDEQRNDATIDAVADNGMNYYFAESGVGRAVPTLVHSLTTGATLVSLPRIGADDYQLWHTEKLGYLESIDRADQEIKWGATLGGLLAFDFHTFFVSDEHLQVLERYVQGMRQDGAFLATGGDIASWWRVRDRLIRGEDVAPELLARYQPVRLTVRPDGSLVRVTAPGVIAASSQEGTARTAQQ